MLLSGWIFLIILIILLVILGGDFQGESGEGKSQSNQQKEERANVSVNVNAKSFLPRDSLMDLIPLQLVALGNGLGFPILVHSHL